MARKSTAAVADEGGAGDEGGADDRTSTAVAATGAIGGDQASAETGNPRPSGHRRDSVSGRSARPTSLNGGSILASSMHMGGSAETPVSAEAESHGTNPLYKTLAPLNRTSSSTIPKVCF